MAHEHHETPVCSSMAPTILTDLPPELLDHITAYLPTARSVSSLGKASKSLHDFVEKDAWQTLSRTRFPSLHPAHPPSHKDAARSLVTLSRAWNRRAFIARYVEPHGDIRAYPGDKQVERWKRPKGQTIGFTPQLDVYEEVGPRWQDRHETLAFSAGAEVCVRKKRRRDGRESVRWMTYRPLSAYEGRDDVTTLHFLKSESGGGIDDGAQRLISGTANGDLWILSLPEGDRGDVPITYFFTQGLPVRSSSLLQRPFEQTLLAANMGDSRVSIYPVDPTQPKIAPSSSIDIRPPQAGNGQKARHQRVWSTQFLSPQRLAAGTGPSDEPIHVYSLTPSGLDEDPIRKFSLQDHDSNHCILEESSPAPTTQASIPPKKPSSSIYPIVPLPPSSTAGSSSEGSVFLSGAYDSIIRLHDLRSNCDVEQAYTDPTDDSAIYSLLPRGQESLVAGTSRHSLLKVFDLRLGAKCYDYLDATPTTAAHQPMQKGRTKDWNLFLKPHTSTSSSAGGRRGSYYSSRGTHESSVYSLASPSPSSPFLYAGVENAVVELAFTSILDPHPDSLFFAPWQPPAAKGRDDSWRSREVLDLAMYDQSADVKLFTQRSVWETWRVSRNPVGRTLEFPRVEGGWDERWRVGGGMG